MTIATALVLLTGCGDATPADRTPRQLVASEARGPTFDNPFENTGSAAADDAAANATGATGMENDGAAVDAVPDATMATPAETQTYPQSRPADAGEATGSAEGSCNDGKRVCGDMTSCADARFHLEQCGMSRLDGDSDGTPCEKICG